MIFTLRGERRLVIGSEGGRCIDGNTLGYRFAAPVFLRPTGIERGERKRADAGSRIYFRGALTRVPRDGNRRTGEERQRRRGRGEFMCLERVKGTRVATSAAESYSWMQQGIVTSCCIRSFGLRATINMQAEREGRSGKGRKKRQREERRGMREKRFRLEKGIVRIHRYSEFSPAHRSIYRERNHANDST